MTNGEFAKIINENSSIDAKFVLSENKISAKSSDCIYVDDIEWDLDENEENINDLELPEVVLIPFDMAEDGNGTLNADMAIDSASDAIGFCIKSCSVEVEVSVPFSEAILAYDSYEGRNSEKTGSCDYPSSLIHDKLNSSPEKWNIFDDFPINMNISVPLDVLQDYYDNHILQDDDFKNGEDIRLSKWLSDRYTLDDMTDLFIFWDMHYDFDITKAIPNIEKWVNEVKEALDIPVQSLDNENIERE